MFFMAEDEVFTRVPNVIQRMPFALETSGEKWIMMNHGDVDVGELWIVMDSFMDSFMMF